MILSRLTHHVSRLISLAIKILKLPNPFFHFPDANSNPCICRCRCDYRSCNSGALPWGFVFWVFLIPDSATQEVADNAATQEMLSEHFPAEGMYFVPGGDPDDPAWAELHAKGPIAMVSVTAGRPPQEISVFIKGIVIEIFIAALIAWMLTLAAPSLPAYSQRVIFVCIAGLTATLLTAT